MVNYFQCQNMHGKLFSMSKHATGRPAMAFNYIGITKVLDLPFERFWRDDFKVQRCMNHLCPFVRQQFSTSKWFSYRLKGIGETTPKPNRSSKSLHLSITFYSETTGTRTTKESFEKYRRLAETLSTQHRLQCLNQTLAAEA